jgi:hypothetical protein
MLAVVELAVRDGAGRRGGREQQHGHSGEGDSQSVHL